jgi:hypothetical protein
MQLGVEGVSGDACSLVPEGEFSASPLQRHRRWIQPAHPEVIAPLPEPQTGCRGQSPADPLTTDQQHYQEEVKVANSKVWFAHFWLTQTPAICKALLLGLALKPEETHKRGQVESLGRGQ